MCGSIDRFNFMRNHGQYTGPEKVTFSICVEKKLVSCGFLRYSVMLRWHHIQAFDEWGCTWGSRPLHWGVSLTIFGDDYTSRGGDVEIDIKRDRKSVV